MSSLVSSRCFPFEPDQLRRFVSLLFLRLARRKGGRVHICERLHALNPCWCGRGARSLNSPWRRPPEAFKVQYIAAAVVQPQSCNMIPFLPAS
jgi:hypothetical protein